MNRPGGGPSLGDDVHVWRAALDRAAGDVAQLYGLLSDDERRRADRFVRDTHRAHFTVARGLLRRLLARYLGIHPGDVTFGSEGNGKPTLAPDTNGRRPFHFNVTHAQGVVLYAISGSAVGVDVEQIRNYPGARNIWDRFFSERERRLLGRLPDQAMFEAFFNGWTRKEAFLKCHGAGLSYGLDRVEVTLLPDEPPRVLAVDGDHREAAAWSMTAFRPYEGYTAAVVLRRPAHEIRVFDLE